MFERGSAEVSLRVEVLRGGGVYTTLYPLQAPEVQMKGESALKMSMRGEFLKPEKDVAWLTDRIRPVLIIDGTEYPVGLYIGTTPRRRGNSRETSVVLEAYSVLYLADRTKMEPGYIIRAGTLYIAAIQELLQLAGIDMYVSDTSDKRIQTDRADWDAGTSVLEVVNELLAEINYRDVWVDLEGTVHLTARNREAVPASAARITTSSNTVRATVRSVSVSGDTVTVGVESISDSGDTVTVGVLDDPIPDTSGQPDHIYAAGQYSIISDDVDVTTDYFDKANVFRVVYSSPDLPEPMSVEVVNADPDSPFSTATLGIRIVKQQEVNGAADLEELQEMAAQMMYEEMQTTEQIEFTTALNPVHGTYDRVALDAGGESGIYEETAWRMILDASGEMWHRAERIII